MKPELVIFDCDGVLVDSEALSISSLLDMVAKAGGTIGEEVAYERFLGRSMASVREMLTHEFRLTITDTHLSAMRVDLMRKFREELKPMAGVIEILADLPIACCVASSGTLDRIRYSLEVTGLLDLLEPHLFSATMVTRGKPAPDLFLHAAAAMGKVPAACLVVEDSPAGVQAAQSAGMRVAAFVGGSHAAGPGLTARLASMHPDFIFADMVQLPGLIAHMGAREKTS